MKKPTVKKEKTPKPHSFEVGVAWKLININNSANTRKIPCTITFQHLKKLMLKKRCFFTGDKFNQEDIKKKFTIDRVDSSKGYTNENTVACTHEFNQLKKNLGPSDVKLLYDVFKKRKML